MGSGGGREGAREPRPSRPRGRRDGGEENVFLDSLRASHPLAGQLGHERLVGVRGGAHCREGRPGGHYVGPEGVPLTAFTAAFAVAFTAAFTATFTAIFIGAVAIAAATVTTTVAAASATATTVPILVHRVAVLVVIAAPVTASQRRLFTTAPARQPETATVGVVARGTITPSAATATTTITTTTAGRR